MNEPHHACCALIVEGDHSVLLVGHMIQLAIEVCLGV